MLAGIILAHRIGEAQAHVALGQELKVGVPSLVPQLLGPLVPLLRVVQRQLVCVLCRLTPPRDKLAAERTAERGTGR